MRSRGRLGMAAALVLASAALGQDDGPDDEAMFNWRSLSHWLTELKSEYAGVRRDAVQALGQHHGSAWWRSQAEAGLAISALRTALADADPAVRTQAALSLAALDAAEGLKGRKTLPALRAALQDPDPKVRTQAAVAVARLAPDNARDALTVLRANLNLARPHGSLDTDTVAAWRALARVNQDAVPALVAAMQDPDHWYTAGMLLAAIGPPAARAALPALRQWRLREPDARERNRILSWELTIDPGLLPAVLPLLLADLKGPDEHAREAALHILVQVGPKAAAAVPTVLEVFQSDPKRRTLDNLAILCGLGAAAKDTVPALVAQLRSNETLEACMAAEALRILGPAAKDAVPALRKMLMGPALWLIPLESANSLERLLAMGALQLPAPTVLPKALEATVLGFRLYYFARYLGQRMKGDGFAQEAYCAARALVRIDPRQAAVAVPVLAACLREPVELLYAFRANTEALAALGPAAKAAIPALRQAAGAREGFFPRGLRGGFFYRGLALAALARVDPTEARAFVPALVAALRGVNILERCDAAWMLGQIGPKARSAVPALIAALKEPGLRIPAAWALGRIGPAAKEAVPALLAAFDGAAPTDPPVAEAEATMGAMLADPGTLAAAEVAQLRQGREYNPADEIQRYLEVRGPETAVLRREVATALGSLGNDTPEVRKALLAGRRDADTPLRLRAAVALTRVTPAAAPDVLPGLRTALRDEHPGVRAGAALALATVGLVPQEVVAELEALRQDTNLSVRNAANQSLRTLGR